MKILGYSMGERKDIYCNQKKFGWFLDHIISEKHQADFYQVYNKTMRHTYECNYDKNKLTYSNI